MHEKLLIIIILVESIILHEIAHGYVAGLFGDPTARRMGRITLNPIPHIDPIWTILIPAVAYFLSGGSFVIGGAKPVPVNPYNYRRPILGDLCVSVAGVAVNFLLAVVLILLINMVRFVSHTTAVTVVGILFQAALLNLVLTLFNLIPIPPLDGSHLMKYLLPERLRASYAKLGRSGAGFFILIVLMQVPGIWRWFSIALITVKDFLLNHLIFF